MREKHPNYMPFNRYFDEEGVGEGFGGGKGFVDVTNPVKRIEVRAEMSLIHLKAL